MKLTNALLAVIAICLGLIVVRLYGLPPSAAAAPEVQQAQRVEVSNVPLPVELAGDKPIRVQLYYRAGNAWRPVTVHSGAIFVRQ